MFGLEDQKKKKPAGQLFFELEKELKLPHKYRELRQKVEGRIQKIKDSLREGEKHEEFDRFVNLLQGYYALLKVMIRVGEPKKK